MQALGLERFVTRLARSELGEPEVSSALGFDVSQHPAMVLLQFNGLYISGSCVSTQELGGGGGEAPTRTTAALRAATGIEAEELKRTLQSLALGQVRVLKKEPKGREVEDGDTFSFNAGLTHERFRVKVNQIQHSETKAEAEETNERVASDRLYEIDAAIVRVLKARKTIEHTTLMGELLSQLRFSAAAADIKKRMESLIERDYISRDPRDTNVYHYAS